MAGEFCLDTNISVAFLQTKCYRPGHGHAGVIAKVGTAARVALSVPVAGELLFGAKKSARIAANLERFRRFIQACDTIETDLDVAEVYADIKLTLKKQGTPIPENDIWIAACAKHTGLTLVTDDKHFDHIPDLTTENWL